VIKGKLQSIFDLSELLKFLPNEYESVLNDVIEDNFKAYFLKASICIDFSLKASLAKLAFNEKSRLHIKMRLQAKCILKNIKPGVSMNFRLILVILLLAGTVTGSWIASEPIYRFYLQIWYRDVKNVTPELMEKHATRLFDRHEYEELTRYLNRLAVIYSSDSKILRKSGLYFLRMKERERGVELISAALDLGTIPLSELKAAVSVLFQEQYYGDVEGILKKKQPVTDPDLQYYYGVSLFKMGYFSDSADILKKAYRNGYQDARSLFFLGSAMSASGNYEGAELYLEMAWQKERFNRDIRKALADVYRRQGKLEKAAAIMTGRR